MFYEIIAHLFKHSFIDVIINFNFDEILDQAIKEELGRDNYHYIISDGDCVPINDLMVDGRLKIPIYIKPHGTVSHKSTLRFTKRHYLDIPEQIKRIIIDLITGKRGEVRGAKVENISQINLISAGFNMESLEFCDIVNAHLPEQSKIYHLCFENTEERSKNGFVKNVFEKFYRRAYHYHIIEKNKTWDLTELDNHIYKRLAVESFNHFNTKNELTTPFAEIFSYVWRKAYYSFHSHFRPRSIARHEIINYLFYDLRFSQHDLKTPAEINRTRLTQTYEESIEYFLDRTIIEIAIAINRNNGIIEISQLLGDRAGSYYKNYRDRYYQIHKTNRGAVSIYDLLNEFQSPKRYSEHDATYCKNVFEIDMHSFESLKSDEVLLDITDNKPQLRKSVNERMRRWENKSLVYDENAKPKIENGRHCLNAMLKYFYVILHHTEPTYNPISIMVLYRLFEVKYLSERFLDNFKKNFDKHIYNGKYYDASLYPGDKVNLLQEIARLFLKSSRQHYYSIRPKYHDPKNYISESFSKTRILHTILSVDYYFKSMFLNTDWDIILMISETGSMLNFLRNEPNAKNKLIGKKIIALNAYEAIKQLHTGEKNIRNVNETHNIQYLNLIGDEAESSEKIFYTFSLPSVRHNHHMILFMKKIQIGEKFDKYDVLISGSVEKEIRPLFKMSAAMYIYRQGFSNYLNPLFIGMAPYNSGEDIHALSHDFKKLVRIFTITFCRALLFEGTKRIQGLNLDLDTSAITADEEENIRCFLAYLYDTSNANFLPD